MVLVFLFEIPRLPAVIGYRRVFHGQDVQCFHGGSWPGQVQLGVYSRARRYDQVFTGTVQSATEISFTDRQPEIAPDEVFSGDITGRLTAIVNQACLAQGLPEIKAGDKWLFYVSRRQSFYTGDHPHLMPEVLIVVYDSPAKPLAMASYDICLLRHHSDIEEDCIALMPKLPTQSEFDFCHTQRLKSAEIANPFAMSAEPRPESFFELPLSGVKVPAEFRPVNQKRDTSTTSVTKGDPWSELGCTTFFSSWFHDPSR
jgi:hypothetical protein